MNVSGLQNMDMSLKYLENLCRTCMHVVTEDEKADTTAKTAEQKWQFIFNTVAAFGTMSIAELLINTLPKIKIEENDMLPNKICCDCLGQLINSYRFQQKCLQSELQICTLISGKELQTKMQTLQDSKTEDRLNCKEFIVEELFLETEEQRIGVKCENPLSEVTQSQNEIADPLKESFDDLENKYDKDEEEQDINASVYNECVKNEPLDVEDIETAVNYRNHDGTIPATVVNVKDETIITKEKQNKNKHVQQTTMIQDGRKTTREHYQFNCDICERHFRKPESLHKHRLTHNHEKACVTAIKPTRYSCESCAKTFSSRQTLWTHKSYHCGGKALRKLNFSCEICKKNFRYPAALKTHLNTHTDERPYLCTECGKAFRSPGALKQHILRHADARPFECPYCPKKFPCQADLAIHKAIHEKVKRHICDICGASLCRQYQLKIHKMGHSGEKPFKCDYCDMRFVRMVATRRHMLTHTGEKPYKCQYCDRAFAQSNDHIKHLRTHIGENVYRCEFCPRAFRLASEMRLHFTTHKHDDEETRERNMKALKEAETKLQLKLAGK